MRGATYPTALLGAVLLLLGWSAIIEGDTLAPQNLSAFKELRVTPRKPPRTPILANGTSLSQP